MSKAIDVGYVGGQIMSIYLSLESFPGDIVWMLLVLRILHLCTIYFPYSTDMILIKSSIGHATFFAENHSLTCRLIQNQM